MKGIGSFAPPKCTKSYTRQNLHLKAHGMLSTIHNNTIHTLIRANR